MCWCDMSKDSVGLDLLELDEMSLLGECSHIRLSFSNFYVTIKPPILIIYVKIF